MTVDASTPRRRPRRGSVERPVSARIYRVSWIPFGLAVLLAAFTVAPSEPLAPPDLPPTFDGAAALQYAGELATTFPDRAPGTQGALGAARWTADRLRDLGLTPRAVTFTAEIPGVGRRPFANVFGILRGDSPQTIVFIAHRDDTGQSPGANDNASGTGALLELARDAVIPRRGEGERATAHTLVFLSTDGGTTGGTGAAYFAERPESVTRFIGPSASVIAAVSLDAIAGSGPPALALAGNVAASPGGTLVVSAAEAVEAQTGAPPELPGALWQGLDLAFPFGLYEQAPLLAGGVSALTLTTSGDRPPPPLGDTVAALDADQLAEVGAAAQSLLLSLDEAAEVTRGTRSAVHLEGGRLVHGWAVQLALLAALLPFFTAVLDLFARTRRRGIRLAPALRSLRSRLLLWAWAGGLFALFSLVGIFPNGPDLPLGLETPAARDWPVLGLIALGGLVAVGWLLARPRLAGSGQADPVEDLAGHLVAMLALGIAALVVAAVNPFSLVLVLPSLHAWLWLPHLAARPLPLRVALFASGFAGPALLVTAFAVRLDLGIDAVWYLLALTSVGFVPTALLLGFLLWGAVAEQVGALAAGRYAPYPEAAERLRGPVRESIRHAVLRRRAAAPRD